MDRLPPELIARVFRAAETRTNAVLNWTEDRAYSSFLQSVSLVSRQWHDISVEVREMFFLKNMKSAWLLYEAMQAGAKFNIRYLYIPDSAHAKYDNISLVSPYIIGLHDLGLDQVVALCVPAALLSSGCIGSSIIRLMAGKVFHLTLRGYPEPLTPFDWSSADYIHNNKHLKNLDICNVHLAVELANMGLLTKAAMQLTSSYYVSNAKIHQNCRECFLLQLPSIWVRARRSL